MLCKVYFCCFQHGDKFDAFYAHQRYFQSNSR